MSPLPDNYHIDFESSKQDLQLRGVQRLLTQFQNSPVLTGVLNAIVAEVKVLSDAIVDVQASFSLEKATGDSLTILGTIVGVTRSNWSYVSAPMLTESGLDILTEAGEIIIGNAHSFDLSDEDMLTKVRVKIASNFARTCSIPEITKCIKDIVGVAARINVTGPMTMQVLVPNDTPANITDLLMYVSSTSNTNNEYLFPYPATAGVSIGYY